MIRRNCRSIFGYVGQVDSGVMRKRIWTIAAVTVVSLVGGILLLAWFSREPSHNGKTVTEWLNALELYSRQPNATGIEVVLRSPDAIAADPALHALTNIGPSAVPVLMRRISEPAELPQTMTLPARWKFWAQWRWFRMRGPGKATRPTSGNWSEAQEARKTAAGVALLALGTNRDGGFARFMEAYATAPQFTSAYRGQVTGMPVGVSPSSVVKAAIAALPQRHNEIVSDVMAFLEHTNAIYRQSALECGHVLPRELLRRKDVLLKLTQDEGEFVKAAALGNLLLIVQQPALREFLSPMEIRQAAQAVADAPGTSARNRTLALTVVGVAEEQAEKGNPKL